MERSLGNGVFQNPRFRVQLISDMAMSVSFNPEDRAECGPCGSPLRLRDVRAHLLVCQPLRDELARDFRQAPFRRRAWMDRAECRTLDPEDFFVDEASYVTTPIERAMRACALCPVRRECLLYAYESDHTEEQGIYAGTRGRDRALAKHRPDRIEHLLAEQDSEVRRRGLVMRGEVA